MKAERKPFMAISADIDDTQLEKLAQDKGVATMVKSTPQAEPVVDPKTIPTPRAGRKSLPEQDASITSLPDDVPTPRSRMKNYSIDLPDYVLRELKIRAAHRETSIRHVILTSLRNELFEIRDADMNEDGRRDRT